MFNGKKKKLIALAVAGVLMLSAIPLYNKVSVRAEEAETPTAQIVGMDGSTSDLRVSQLLTVKTTGFQPGTESYNWYNGFDAGLLNWQYVFSSLNMYDGGFSVPLGHENWSEVTPKS